METGKAMETKKVQYGTDRDIIAWMDLVEEVRFQFPGMETDASMAEHRETVLGFMKKRQALCVKDGKAVVGVLLFARKERMICCLAVSPEYRRRGIGSKLLSAALEELAGPGDIVVSTYRKEDGNGAPARALYRKFGFREGALLEEFGYPVQQFVLRPRAGAWG